MVKILFNGSIFIRLYLCGKYDDVILISVDIRVGESRRRVTKWIRFLVYVGIVNFKIV